MFVSFVKNAKQKYKALFSNPKSGAEFTIISACGEKRMVNSLPPLAAFFHSEGGRRGRTYFEEKQIKLPQ